MFCETNITNVTSGFLYNGVTNKKLKHIEAIFYNCRNISGTSPYFWDPNYFNAIELSQSGYYGALYNCTGLTNYSIAQTNNGNWVAQQQIYAP
jgi:hypothetical protein